MDRAQKKQEVADIKEMLSSATSAVVVHYHGLTVADISNLRTKARKNGVKIKVSKNTLAKIAANDTDFSGIAAMLTGPTAIAVSEDEISAAKIMVDFAKANEKLVIVGGIVAGNTLDEKAVKSLAQMPSLDESRAKLIGLLQAPASKLARLLQTPGGQVARVINAHAKKGV